MHHLAEIGMTLRSVETLVFDEADRLFEMGFSDQISEVMKSMSEKRYHKHPLQDSRSFSSSQ